MITMLSHVLFSYAAFDFPIHTLRLLHSLALASQFTLCTPFASVLSGFSTNTVFNVSLSFPVVRDTCPVSRKIKRNLKERRKLYFFLVYTLLSSSRGRSRLRLLQYFSLSVTSVPSLFVIPHYPHYPVGVRDCCYASRTFGGRTVRT